VAIGVLVYRHWPTFGLVRTLISVLAALFLARVGWLRLVNVERATTREIEVTLDDASDDKDPGSAA